MPIKIASSPTFEAAAQKAVEVWHIAGSPKLIRLEGFTSAGKTGLATLLASLLDGIHVEGDIFVSKYDDPPAYRDCMRQAEFDAAITEAVASSRVVILDAVCLDEVAPSEKWGRGFVVYIKRLSFNNTDPIWHEGFRLEDEAPADEMHRSVHLYHNRVKPHETAELIIELPDEGHLMTKGGYNRNMCFDPEDAEII